MNLLRNYHFVPVLLMVWVCFLLTACDNTKATDENAKAGQSATIIATDNNVIEMPHPEDFTLVKADIRMLPEELAVNGSIVPDINRTVAVNALAGGRVVELNAKLGDSVKKNQLLLRMHSPDLANAIAALKQAQADELLAQRQYDRNKFLYEHGAVVSQNDFQMSEDNWAGAKANTENAITQVKLLSADPRHPSAFIDVRAPAAGVIVEQNYTAGAAAKSLDATPNLFTIADLSKVWLLCDVYENNLSQVKVGDYARIRLNAYPDRGLQGKVSNIFSLLDPATRSVKVRIELDNPDGILLPGMFATATFVSQGKIPRVVIPATAIFRLHDKDWLFLPEGKNKFRRAEVKAGPADRDGSMQVLSGLEAGQMVVSNALQFSAEARSENPLAFLEHDKKAQP
ncbi:MAG: efflux RND transporter periplasmic adaptor subunit [Methylococcales bacterium]|nr:efflux RND transporter periplasmic adaptor subunit [Methylococcales bacterium]